jgi:hypothetical protein
LASIRKHLPDAEIILSTWEDWDQKDYPRLPLDKIVLSPDPGGLIADEVHNVRNNVNRQILSTKAGLAHSTKPYSIKIRSDMTIEGTSFLKYFDRFPKRATDFCILKKRVIVSNLYTAHPKKTYFLFHPSDWFYFGLTEDVKNIWDIPLAPEPETSFWFKSRPRPLIDRIPFWNARFLPEQYIWLSFLKKNGYKIKYRHITDYGEEQLINSELSLINNVIVLDYKRQLNVNFLKYNPYMHDAKNQQNHFYWLDQYKHYCDPGYCLPLRLQLENDRSFRRYRSRLIRFLNRFYQPFSRPLRWFFSFFISFYWMVLFLARILLLWIKRKEN